MTAASDASIVTVDDVITRTQHAIQQHALKQPNRPYVTLTYAQSLDGCIATQQHEMLPLSCSQSMVMTHRLRSIHQGILVGVGTAIADNPSLTTRLVEGPSPIPIVIDTNGRLPLNVRLRFRPHIIVTRQGVQLPADEDCTHIKAATTSDGHIDLPDALQQLSQHHGLTSIMIEGGQRIISSMLQTLKHGSASLVDQVIVTISPSYVGGLHTLQQSVYQQASQQAVTPLQRYTFPHLNDVRYAMAGSDIIVSGNVPTENSNSG